MPTPPVPTRDGRAVVTTDFGSRIVWHDRRRVYAGDLVGDVPETVLPLVIDRLRTLNDKAADPSREQALAITHCEEALHWLDARNERRPS